LTYEYSYELDEHLREAIVPGLSRDEEDDSLEQYYELFYPLEHYVRVQKAPSLIHRLDGP